VNRRKIASVVAVPSRIAVAYLITLPVGVDGAGELLEVDRVGKCGFWQPQVPDHDNQSRPVLGVPGEMGTAPYANGA
jgi:hypothetical protein